MRSLTTSLAALLAIPTLISAQLSGPVGPLTTIAQKKAIKTCDVTSYGAKADKSTDLGPPLTAAWTACKSGGVVVIPKGDYAMKTWVTLNGGSKIAIQLDGTIYRTGTDAGNMIMVKRTTDFEMFSSTSTGAMQGLGYELHKQGNMNGARLLRLYEVHDFSLHDIVLVDAPMFHLVLDTCSDGEVYNMAVRGGNSGGLDGIDVWSTNIWIHDVMVTNKDECVTVKSPSKNILIENVYCNWSGGCALGSLGSGTNISDVLYRNVYTINSNQMIMIKSNGGSGLVENVGFENFIGHGNAYSLDVDQYWSSMKTIEGNGVQLNNITFKKWRGTAANGSQRGPVKVACADGAPCTDISISDFAMWTDTGSIIKYTCQSAYGSGACLKQESGSPAKYAMTTTTISAKPAGYTASKMSEDLTTHFGTAASIPIPTLPASFFPGVQPFSAFLGKAASAAAVTKREDAADITTTPSASPTEIVFSFANTDGGVTITAGVPSAEETSSSVEDVSPSSTVTSIPVTDDASQTSAPSQTETASSSSATGFVTSAKNTVACSLGAGASSSPSSAAAVPAFSPTTKVRDASGIAAPTGKVPYWQQHGGHRGGRGGRHQHWA